MCLPTCNVVHTLEVSFECDAASCAFADESCHLPQVRKMRQLVASIVSKQNKTPLAHVQFMHASTFVHKSSFVMRMPQGRAQGM